MIRIESLPHSRTEEVIFASKAELQLAVKLYSPFLESFRQSDLQDDTYFTFRKVRNAKKPKNPSLKQIAKVFREASERLARANWEIAHSDGTGSLDYAIKSKHKTNSGSGNGLRLPDTGEESLSSHTPQGNKRFSRSKEHRR